MGNRDKSGSKYFVRCLGVSFFISMICAFSYESGFMGLDGYLDGASSLFAEFLGIFRMIDVGMSGSDLYKAMVSVQIITSPLMFFLFFPMRSVGDFFGLDRLPGYFLMLALCVVFLLWGPVHESPGGRGRGFLYVCGSNFVVFGVFIAGIFSSTLASLFLVMEVLRRLIMRDH